MHFGLDSYVGLILYVAGVFALLATLLWRPIVGLFYLEALIPLQTMRYRMNDFPLGGSIIGVMILAVALGALRRRQWILPKTPLTGVLLVYAIFTFVSLWMGSFYLGAPLPFPGDARFDMWLDYMFMPALVILVVAVQPTRRQMMAIVLIMCLAGLALNRGFHDEISGRDFSQFSNSLRDEGGSMGYAGINGLAAFEAQFATMLLAFAAFERKRLLKLGYYALAGFSATCLMYSLSRGGYAALLVGALFLGVVKQRKLLVLMALFAVTWAAVVPNAVVQRVQMTDEGGELDHSSETRITLWEDAMQLFDSNVATGTGFDTYAFMHRIGKYEDTHNFFLKVMVETGVLGLLLFFWLLAKMFKMGYRLFRKAKDPFFASLGLGLAGWMAAAMIANCFGDRWSFLQVGGYMWVLAGLVARAVQLEAAPMAEDGAAGAAAAAQEPQAVPVA
jgi:putative inorganic carbon (HCO3(-)) transporter